MRTATQEMMWIDIRRNRAEVLAAAVMRGLYPKIDATPPDDLPHRINRLVHDAMFEVMHEHGVEVLTDHDRERAGLPPRGPDGWTVEELVALERRRLDILLAPMKPVVVPAHFAHAFSETNEQQP